MSTVPQRCASLGPPHICARLGAIDLEAIYRTHSRRLYLLALRMTGDVAAAEDVLQEAFVQAWMHRDTFRSASTLTTWVHRIAVRCALRYLRDVSRHDRRFARIDGTDALTVAVRSVVPETDIDLERAIAKLPPRARLAFLLHQVEAYSLQEVAVQMGTALGTVKAQLHRARRLLMEDLTR